MFETILRYKYSIENTQETLQKTKLLDSINKDNWSITSLSLPLWTSFVGLTLSATS